MNDLKIEDFDSLPAHRKENVSAFLEKRRTHVNHDVVAFVISFFKFILILIKLLFLLIDFHFLLLAASCSCCCLPDSTSHHLNKHGFSGIQLSWQAGSCFSLIQVTLVLLYCTSSSSSSSSFPSQMLRFLCMQRHECHQWLGFEDECLPHDLCRKSLNCKLKKPPRATTQHAQHAQHTAHQVIWFLVLALK